MKYAIMSDVHSNPEAFCLALRDAKEHGIETKEQRILLGDIVGYGYDPVQCLEAARDLFGVVLMGNHDLAVAGSRIIEYFSKTAMEGVLRERGVVGDEWKKWIKKLPYRIENPEGHFIAAHGTYDEAIGFHYLNNRFNMMMEIDLLKNKLKEPGKFNIEFVGHTHHKQMVSFNVDTHSLDFALDDDPFFVEPDKLYLINVGSVGYPRADRCISYVIYDTDSGKVEFRKLKFDFKEYARRMKDKDIPLPMWLEDELEREERWSNSHSMNPFG